MTHLRLLAAVALATCGLPVVGAHAAPDAPVRLRCEHLTNPLGIDTTEPRFSWEVTDSRRGAVQSAYQIVVADDPAKLGEGKDALWDTGKVESDRTLGVVYAGKPLQARANAWWKVRTWDAAGEPSPWSAPARFSVGLLAKDDWKAAWIGAERNDDQENRDPPLLLRKAFELEAGLPIKRATAYVSALGVYDFHLNGERISNRRLAPDWTDYLQHVQYQAYDVTEQLRGGANTIGAVLADGWYAGRIGLMRLDPQKRTRGVYGPQPLFLLQLEIELADGQVRRIATDDSWKYTAEGPWRSADILDGTEYDARKEIAGWDAPGDVDGQWRGVSVRKMPDVRVTAQPNEPIRVTQEIHPKEVTHPQPGVYVFDLGQNFAGACRLRIEHPEAGQRVVLRHVEMLNSNGTVYIENLRSAKQTDAYTCRGGAEPEVFEPRFTYHGFRFVEVTGLTQEPTPDQLTGLVFNSDAPEIGEFSCSNEMVNRLWENILWTQRMNFYSVPTDCPQRDERLGWTGDINAFVQTACYNMDLSAFFTKWLVDVREAQAKDGRYPNFAPHPFVPDDRLSGSPAWGDAGIEVPWAAYVNYADRRMLETHYDSAKRWVDWIHSQNPDLLWKNNRNSDYGDWLNADTLKMDGWPKEGAAMPKEAFGTAFYYRSTNTVAKMARVLDKQEDAKTYADRAEGIRKAFQKAYIDEEGHIQGETQGGYAIALNFDLVPDKLRTAAAEYMVKCFDRYKGRISTGFLGTVCLMNELTRTGHNEDAYRLLSCREFPSWGYTIEQGATTIWERWDGYVEGRGFQDWRMNSFAHYALGAVGEWMYRTVLGINPDPENPGFKRIILRPVPGGDLTAASGSHHTIRGAVVVSWRLVEDRLEYDVTIPANTTARLYLPTSDPSSVKEGGKPVKEVEGIKAQGVEDGAAVYDFPAGSYKFTAAR